MNSVLSINGKTLVRESAGSMGTSAGSMGTPLFLSVLSLNQLKDIAGSDSLAPIGRPGCGRLADSKQFRYGHGVMPKLRMAQLHIRLLA